MTGEFSDVLDDDDSIAFDLVDKPRHYAGDGVVDCFRASRSMFHGYERIGAFEAIFWFNAFKYLWRWKLKGGLTDLHKCKRMIDLLIKEVCKQQTDFHEKADDRRKERFECGTKTRSSL